MTIRQLVATALLLTALSVAAGVVVGLCVVSIVELVSASVDAPDATSVCPQY